MRKFECRNCTYTFFEAKGNRWKLVKQITEDKGVTGMYKEYADCPNCRGVLEEITKEEEAE